MRHKSNKLATPSYPIQALEKIHGEWLSNIMQTTQFEIKVAPNNIGRMAEIRVQGHVVVGNVIDLVAGTDYPKRIRIQHGFPELHGSIVRPGEYEVLWFCNEEED